MQNRKGKCYETSKKCICGMEYGIHQKLDEHYENLRKQEQSLDCG